MKKFKQSQVIRITDNEHPMHGKTGTVRRLRRGDDGALVHMSELPPEEFRLFPVGDESGREYSQLLYPEQCEAVQS